MRASHITLEIEINKGRKEDKERGHSHPRVVDGVGKRNKIYLFFFPFNLSTNQGMGSSPIPEERTDPQGHSGTMTCSRGGYFSHHLHK